MATILTATGITFSDSTSLNTVPPAGVTSVAVGNGLQGGTITSSGTLSIAAPSFNSVGSYCNVRINALGTLFNVTSGSNYAAGAGDQQIQSGITHIQTYQNNLSGTWKWMGATTQIGNVDGYFPSTFSIAVRVS